MILNAPARTDKDRLPPGRTLSRFHGEWHRFGSAQFERARQDGDARCRDLWRRE